MEPVLEHFSAQIRQAVAAAAPLRIRGGGSKDFYGHSSSDALLDTRAWCGISAYEPSELVVTARCGTPLAELEEALAAQGQCLAFEPPRFAAGATVGGMVAAGLSGPARANAGAVRDFVLGVSLLNGRAELLRFGGQVMKNVAGYDVSRLMVGALGTLGLITDVSLKVMPKAPAEATLCFEWGQQQALQQLQRWGGQPLPLNASCWQHTAGADVLHLRLRGARAAVDAACRQLGGERLDAAPASALWQGCRDQQLPWFQARAQHDLWRLSLPPSAAALALGGAAQLLEWHGAQRWLWLDAGNVAAARQLRQQVAELGGHATLFIANNACVESGEARFDSLSVPLQKIHQTLKQAFDPARILNRGRLYADL